MSAIDNALNVGKPITFQKLWQAVHTDLDTRTQLGEILANLTVAEKIQVINGEGYLPIKKVIDEGITGTIDWNLLTQLERNII